MSSKADEQQTAGEGGQSTHPSLTEVLLRSLASAVIAVDGRRHITAFNRAAERLTGLDAGQALQKGFEILPPPFRALLQETFVTGAAISDRQVAIDGGDGGEIVIRANTFPYSRERGRIDAVLLLCHDVSSARKLEANVRRLDRLANIGTLSAGAAHEIKNALVAIKTFAGRLQEQHQDNELAGLVGKEIERIDTIANQLLRLAGPAKPVFAAVNLHSLLENALRLIRQHLDTCEIRLERRFDAPQDAVSADEKQLNQAIINLLFNAVEAIQRKGTIQVLTERVPTAEACLLTGTEQASPHLRLTISDTGPGIPTEHLPYVFDRFFTTKPEGTGLGLPITRTIIQEHGGAIFVESEPGQGARFHVLLPLHSAE